MGRYRAGHHQHISRGGHLEYPELEILPGGPVSVVNKEKLGDFKRAVSYRSVEAMRRGEMTMIAEQWASFYQDCVRGGVEVEMEVGK